MALVYMKVLKSFSNKTVVFQEHCLADVGAFMGRSFRVGWGPGFKVAHTGTLLPQPTMEQEDSEEGTSDAMVTQPPPTSFLFMGSLAAQPKTVPRDEAPR